MEAGNTHRDATATRLGGMLAIWHDVAPGQAAAVREWYGREHHFERLAIPGFLEARRFERVSGTGAEIFGSYRLEATHVLRSDAYRGRVDAPSQWTRDSMQHFRRMSRTVCHIAAQQGQAQAGHLAALASTGDELGDPAAACAELAALPGVLRVTALVAEQQAPVAATAEHALRGGPDAQVRWALLVDADGLASAEAALQAAQAHTACRQAAQFAVYQLCFAARNPL